MTDWIGPAWDISRSPRCEWLSVNIKLPPKNRSIIPAINRKNVWTRALKMANITYQVPYTLRRTFAAWLLTIEIDKKRLVYLMGHGSKKMVYEDYGKYFKNLEKDKDKILRFFGEDFIGQCAGAVS